jgi:hypothetical protein
MALVTNDYFLCKLVIAFSTSKYHERSYIFIPIDSSHRDLSIDMKIIGLRRRRHLLHFCPRFTEAAESECLQQYVIDDGCCAWLNRQRRCTRMNVWTTVLYCPNCHCGFQLRHFQTLKRTNSRIDPDHVYKEGKAIFLATDRQIDLCSVAKLSQVE